MWPNRDIKKQKNTVQSQDIKSQKSKNGNINGKKIAAFVLVLLMFMVMLRLAVWQLSRADEKARLLEQRQQFANAPSVSLFSLLGELTLDKNADLKYKKVFALGDVLSNSVYLLDNKSHQGEAGYHVFSLFKLDDNAHVVFINYGWRPNQSMRVPKIAEQNLQMAKKIQGRLNTPPAKPLLWRESYAALQNGRWQYFPMKDLAQQIKTKYQLELLPLVIELAPQGVKQKKINEKQGKNAESWVREWPKINEHAVNKHNAYAFQWFVMAVVLLLMGLVILVKSLKPTSPKKPIEDKPSENK